MKNEEAEARFQQFGKNSLPEEKQDSILKVFVLQFAGPLIYLLLVAGDIVVIEVYKMLRDDPGRTFGGEEHE